MSINDLWLLTSFRCSTQTLSTHSTTKESKTFPKYSSYQAGWRCSGGNAKRQRQIKKMKCSGKVFSKASPKCTTPWATWLAGQLSLPVHHIQQPGQWPHASKCVALVNPLASFLEAPLHCSSIKTRWRVRRGSAGVCWVGHMQNIPPMTDQAPTWSCF